MDHHLSPPHHPPHHQMSLPTFARSIPVEVATLPASTRTSFTRVDHTRPGTSAGDDGQRDEADPNDEVARASLHGDPEEQEAAAAQIPQIPQTMLQFLLVSGRRKSMVFEPETTVGRVKELVWNTWPNGVSRSRSLFFCLVDYPPCLHLIHLISYSWNCQCRVRFSPPSPQSLLASALLASVFGERADFSQFH